MHIHEVILGEIFTVFWAQAMSQTGVSIPQANDAYCVMPLFHKYLKIPLFT